MALPKPNIGGSQIRAAMSSTQAASVLLQAYTQTILKTPDIKLPADVDEKSSSTVVEDLPKHQATARANATYYLDNVNTVLVQRSADIVGFANLWNAEYARLLQLAKAIDQGDNKATFKQGVANLISQSKTKQGDTSPAITALNDFLPKIASDTRNITADAQHVTVALGGEKGAIATLKKLIDADNAAINKDITIIAAGATADIVGGLMIAVGVLAEFETAGASTALVLAGLVVVAGGTTAMGIAGKGLADTNADLAAKTKELAIDQAVFAGTTQAGHTIAALQTALNQGMAAVTSLQKGWGLLQADFTQVIEQLDLASPDLGTWLVNILEAANTDWADTLKLAQSLQQYGTLPVKTTDYSKAA